MDVKKNIKSNHIAIETIEICLKSWLNVAPHGYERILDCVWCMCVSWYVEVPGANSRRLRYWHDSSLTRKLNGIFFHCGREQILLNLLSV